ncbi:hypothetical protein HF086_014025 [Spodoptera exigua]|uniref:Alcohol dehydrogenase n=1 Tax=Spodoptera exigua TaxID=7107 RepID=A0A922MJ31_SPOEX|nr:hypothetical protein HF086_014025 [Spodoptera exigua]
MWDIKNKTFLITGGASGLGAEYAKACLEHGAKAYGNKVIFVKCDVSKEEDIVSAWDAVLAQFKQVDVIINNAGIMVDAPNMWRTASDVNWQGVVSFTLKGVSHMRKDEGGAGGTILNVASILGLSKLTFLPIYSGSKIAVVHFSQCLTMDPFYENTGVRVLTMCLGCTDTPLVQNLETKSWDPKLGDEIVVNVANNYIRQKKESAVAALIKMLVNGNPGSIWLSVDDKPARDITSAMDNVYKEFEKVMAE